MTYIRVIYCMVYLQDSPIAHLKSEQSRTPNPSRESRLEEPKGMISHSKNVVRTFGLLVPKVHRALGRPCRRSPSTAIPCLVSFLTDDPLVIEASANLSNCLLLSIISPVYRLLQRQTHSRTTMTLDVLRKNYYSVGNISYRSKLVYRQKSLTFF